MTAARVDPREGNSARFAARPLPGGGTPTASGSARGASCRSSIWPTAPKSSWWQRIPTTRRSASARRRRMLAGWACACRWCRPATAGRRIRVSRRSERYRLEHVRRAELHRAVSALGLPAPISLGLPDGEIGDHEGRLADLLSRDSGGPARGTWCAATWRGDGHPDHEAVGRAAAVAVGRTAAELVEYPVWMWHWAYPGDAAVPWDRAFEVPLTREAIDRKYFAAQSFHSQFEPMTADAAARYPTCCVAPAARGGGGGLPLTARLPDAYFDRIYAESADPWQLQSRWYERRKYAITLALLPYRAVPARVRTGLLDRRADRTARQPVRPRHRHRRLGGSVGRNPSQAGRRRAPRLGHAATGRPSMSLGR